MKMNLQEFNIEEDKYHNISTILSIGPNVF